MRAHGVSHSHDSSIFQPSHPGHSMKNRSRSSISKPNLKYANLALITSSPSSISPLPRSHLQALADLNWSNAMCDEYALIDSHT